MDVNPDHLNRITAVLSEIATTSPITSSNAADQVYEILVLLELAGRLGDIRIIDCHGNDCSTYYYRSAPGYLTYNPSSCGAPPGAVSVECEGAVVEFHNGVRWKDYVGATDPEMDVAVVMETDVDPHRGCGEAVDLPIYGSVECKYHAEKISIGDARNSLFASQLVGSRYHSLVSNKSKLDSAERLFNAFEASHFGDVDDPRGVSYTSAMDLIALAMKKRVNG